MENSNNPPAKYNETQPAVLDATDTFCPDLFLVLRRFIKQQLTKSRFVQISTKESRAEARIKHICSEYGYAYKAMEKDGVYSFLLDLRTKEDKGDKS